MAVCKNAKKVGKQYTKRLLPDFLIPYSRIRLDAALAAYQMRIEGASIEACSLAMGCIDLRTVRKHFSRLEQVVTQTSLTIAQQLSHLTQYVSFSQHQPAIEPMAKLSQLYKSATQAALASGFNILSFRNILQAHWWNLVGKFPISCVSLNPRPP